VRRCALLLPALLSLAFAPAPLPDPDPGKEDLKRMHGTWVLVSRTYGGRPLRNGLSKVVIGKGRLTYYGMDDTEASAWLLAVDAGQSPRRYDLKEDARALPAMRGVYEFKGDTLTLCYSQSDAERPGLLASKAPAHWLEVYRRPKR
jgi:uncharacterized protein (TIGR03067 family)